MSETLSHLEPVLEQIDRTDQSDALRFDRAMDCLSGLTVSDLEPDVWSDFEHNCLVKIQHTLVRYDIKGLADYERMPAQQITHMIEVLRDGVAKVIKSETDRIYAELDDMWGALPVAAIHEVRAHRDLMVPVLIDGLREATMLAKQGEEWQGNGPFLALFLLTELDAQEALPAIVEACSLPEAMVNELLGEDLFLGPLTPILAKLARHDWDSIEKLVANKELPYYTRWTSAQAYANLVRDGYMTREEAVRRLEPHLKVAIDERDIDLTSGLVVVLSWLAPREAMETIRLAFQKNLVAPFLARLEELESDCEQGEATLHKRLGQLPPSGIEDAIAELSKWSLDDDPDDDQVPAKRPVEFEPIEIPISSKVDLQSIGYRKEVRPGRNDPCLCGSGRKYKKCCGGPGKDG